MKSQQDELQALMQVAHRCGVATDVLMEWMRERLIVVDDNRWDDETVETVRRIKRLTALGLNLPGVEVALYMRQQLIQHQQQMSRIEEEMRQLRRIHEQQIAPLIHQIPQHPQNQAIRAAGTGQPRPNLTL